MAKNTKTNLYDVIKDFISIVFNRIESLPGRVNIAFGLLIVLVIFLVLFQPVVFYILQMFQSLLNAVLTFFQKAQIPLSDSANTIIVLIICLVILILESIFCSLLVYWSDIKKSELTKNKNR